MADKEIFENFSTQDLFREIVTNARETRAQLKAIIEDISKRVTDTVDLQILSPQISDYMNTLVKNDQILLKLANIVAKSDTNRGSEQSGELTLTPQQKQQLINSVKEDVTPYFNIVKGRNENKIAKVN